MFDDCACDRFGFTEDEVRGILEGDVVLMGFAFWGKVPAIRIENISA